MHTEECLCQWLHPFSGTGQRLFISGNTQDQFIPDVLQLVAGAATSFVWPHGLRSGSPDFSQLQHRWRTRVPVLLTTLARSLHDSAWGG